jgi:hypothetical protein
MNHSFHYAAAALLGLLSASAAEDLHVYFGNLHAHTSYSDGSGFPKEAYAYARDVGKLDFMALTEHNHDAAEGQHKKGTPYEKAGGRKDGVLIANHPELYKGGENSVIGAALKATQDGKFVALYGQEFSTISSGNHVNVFEIDAVIPKMNGDFDHLLKWLDTHPDSQGQFPILQFNHPVSETSPDAVDEYGRDDFTDEAGWIKAMGARARTMEILCGPGTLPKALKPTHFEKQYWDFLNLGFRVAPSGDQDNHYKTWGTLTRARTAVVCPQLTRKDVIEAIRSRHVYATDDPALKVIAKVNGHLCGDVIDRTPNLEFNVDIRNADDENAEYSIAVYADRVGGANAKVVKKLSSHGDGAVGFTVPSKDYDYVAIKIIRNDEDDEDTTHAWLAPVWFN